MSHSKTLIAVLFLSCCFALRAAGETEKQKIEALISHIENLKDATFIRNGSDYNAKNAGRFLRGKWDSPEKEIKTAIDLIEKAASVSSTSGKPYVIRFKDGREVKCGEYMRERLKKFETGK